MPRIDLADRKPEECFSGTELKVQMLASRLARRQLLRVPWRLFRRAYEEYPQWQGLALWSHSVMAGEGHDPSDLLRTLRDRCPGFVGGAISPADLSLGLLEWIHEREFGYAKRQGWLDALIFYGVRHPRSQAAWACWEGYEKKWSQAQTKMLLPFNQWWQSTQETRLCGTVSYGELATTIRRCIDWKTVSLWLRPLSARNVEVPPHVASELNRRYASILSRRDSGPSQHSPEKSETWQEFNKRVRDHCLSAAQRGGWLSILLREVRSHPEHIHIVNYGNHWAKEKQPLCYPSFRQWRQTADCYIEKTSR
ncbi:MAG: hypothetical protein WBD87_05225 [Candidatus Acidiferrales bacterium]